MSKKDLSERDICTKYITPAVITAGWDSHTKIREKVTFNTLSRPLRDYGPRDRVDVVVTNPPFGGTEEDGIKTNLLFFTKGTPTKDVWNYEHPYPEGYKSYSKTKSMRIEDFAPEKAWWGGEKRSGREESEQAWKISVEQIKANGYNLDIKNPNTLEDDLGDPGELLAEYKALLVGVAETREALNLELMDALGGENE